MKLRLATVRLVLTFQSRSCFWLSWLAKPLINRELRPLQDIDKLAAPELSIRVAVATLKNLRCQASTQTTSKLAATSRISVLDSSLNSDILTKIKLYRNYVGFECM
ncbi:hypothetical protein F5Y07DRAFT_352637, partial [Xylaria sp. FL0933]